MSTKEELVEEQLQLHNIQLKIQQLKEQWHSLTPTHREIKLNSIDALTTDLLINAEKKCRKFVTGEVDFLLILLKLDMHGTFGNFY